MVRNPSAAAGTMGVPARPVIRRIGYDDLRAALSEGWCDFRETPTQLVFLGVIYPLVGFVAARAAFGYELLPLLFPMLAGISLLGPVAALGLYEISRRREKGMDTSWMHAFAVLRSPSIGQIALLGAMLTGIFLGWLFSAWFLYRGLLGLPADVSTADFLRAVFTTADGWIMMVIGNSIGLLLAILAFSISVVSFPLIIDRHVDAPTAIRTSIAAVEANPRVMMYWGLMVTGLLVLGCLPMLVGLIVVMPVLGHATWHLYRKVVG